LQREQQQQAQKAIAGPNVGETILSIAVGIPLMAIEYLMTPTVSGTVECESWQGGKVTGSWSAKDDRNGWSVREAQAEARHQIGCK
jgi:hypothetical protein